MSDSTVAAAIASGRVPEGISAAYLNQSKDGGAVVGMIISTILASIFVLGRLLSRVFIVHRVGFDDYLTVVSWIFFIPFVGLCIKLIHLGSGRHFEYIQYVLDEPTVQLTQSLDFAAHIIYTTSLLLCRISGLALYLRICEMHARLLLAIKIVFGIMILGFLPQIFLLLFHCAPVTGYWPYEFEAHYSKYTCLQWGLVYSVNSSVSLLCDFLLFGIPIAMLRLLEITRKRTIQLACILLPGILVIGISVTRLVFVIEGQWQTDMSWAYNPMLAIEVAEIGATLIALSVPGVKPLFDRCILGREASNATPSYGFTSGPGDATALRSLKDRTTHRGEHIIISDRVPHTGSTTAYRNDDPMGDDASENSANGILVQVDFQVKESRVRNSVPVP